MKKSLRKRRFREIEKHNIEEIFDNDDKDSNSSSNNKMVQKCERKTMKINQ
jgi:hypothetical protein